MDETLLFPSPNWFQTSGLAVTRDGWLIYGGPSKSLCLLQPLKPDDQGIILEEQRFKAHFVSRAHAEKIVSVDVSPRWPEKMNVLTGSADGSVKQWNVETADETYLIKSTHSHNTHMNEREEVAGVGYSDETFAVTAGVFGSIVKWDLNSNVVKEYNSFLKSYKITSMACSQHILLNVAVGTKQGVVFVLDLNGPGKLLYKVRAQDEEIFNLSWCPQYEVLVRKSLQESDNRTSLSKRLDKIRNIESESENPNKSWREPENLNKSGRDKNLPEDSFDQSIVEEEDLFDMYKDHEAEEFGHKKFQPIDILVKVKEEAEEQEDFLSECNKLKEEILRRKNEPEPSIESLVEAMDKTHMESGKDEEIPNKLEEDNDKKEKSQKGCESSTHVQKHLLATIGRHGAVRIWSKSGKLVASCAVNTGNKNKKPGSITSNLWVKPDVLLLTDGKNQLLECNPLKIDCKNKLEWKHIHAVHRTGLYGIASNAPKVQVAEDSLESKNWLVWTAAQDRNLVCYSLAEKKIIGVYNTCGGLLYNIQACPYDATKVAVAVGDGAVRVWEAEPTDHDAQFRYGRVLSFWQNVQGKVLTVAWHPTKENLLAFATAEARVGTIDTSGRHERPARTLIPALRGGVYSLCWGDGGELYACGGGECVLYRADKPDAEPESVRVVFEGKSWELSVVTWYPGVLLCGNTVGAVAALAPDTKQVLAVTYPYSKMIHSIQRHPEQTSNSNEESPFKNLIAVCSLDKSYNVVILEYKNDSDKHSLQVWKTLEGHKGVVSQLAWSPHHDGQLVSTSQDGTVRVWDVSSGACAAIFGGHHQPVSAAWCAAPAAGGTVLTGGADCGLRAWTVTSHPPHRYTEVNQVSKNKKKYKDKKNVKKEENGAVEAKKEDSGEETNEVAATLTKTKVSRRFLLPVVNRQIAECNVHSVRKLAEKFLDKDGAEKGGDDDVDTDFVKMFGSTNDLNELLDLEMEKHLEHHRLEAWTMLAIFRGRISDMIEFNAKRDRLCPFLVSQTPGVSPKYWKDVMTLYLAQMDRLSASHDTDKIEARPYGGSAYRRAALQLSVHDARAALASLTQLRLFKEAYVLARVRHMTTAAEGVLREWAEDNVHNGNIPQSAVCYLALGDAYKASTELARMNSQEYLKLASDLAKVAGQHTYASHLADKTERIQNCAPPKPEEDLNPLPTRMELLQIKSENGDA